ncbi:MAG: hypothetical protein HY359_09815 [Candidatus Rokubacteria bacterium]|nr:hypothetical protein [Candidatus Rokubacteria bacterium]
MVRALAAAGLVLALAACPLLARAASWGGITPGETLRRDVEARYGKPSRERTVTEEGRTAPEWTYVGERAPQGMERMVVSFGLIRGTAFAPDLVRAVTLYPRPGVFRVKVVSEGWGKPDAIGTDEQTGRPAFRYDAKGLLVIFDRTGEWAEIMVLAPERPAGAR